MADTNITAGLVAALDKREELANAAKVHWDRFRIETGRHMWPSEALHAQMWPPDVALAHVAHARKVMERHTPETARDTEGCRRTGCCEDGCEVSYCGGCGYIGQDEDDLCPDLLDLASAWGVAA